MFLTKPPCTVAGMIVDGFNGSNDHRCEAQCSLADDAGLKMELLVDTAEKMMKASEHVAEIEWVKVTLYLRMPVSKETNDEWEERERALNLRRDDREAAPTQTVDRETDEQE